MAVFLKTMFLAASLLLPGLLCAESAKKWEVDRIRILPESVSRAPGETVSNGKISTVKFTNNWLLIYIDYTPKSSGGNEWVDDVVMDCRVCIPTSGKSKWVVFQGQTHFWTVSVDGRNRTALMAIPPQLLDRYLPAGKRVSLNSAVICVSFAGGGVNAGYELLCPGTTNKNTAAKYFNDILRESTTVKVSGGVLPREMTPWRYQKMDQTDLIRMELD